MAGRIGWAVLKLGERRERGREKRKRKGEATYSVHTLRKPEAERFCRAQHILITVERGAGRGAS